MNIAPNNTPDTDEDNNCTPITKDQSPAEKLAQAQNTIEELNAARRAADNLVLYYTNNTFRALSRLFVIEKQLPTFYFRQAAEEAGIDKAIFKKYNPSKWPFQQVKSPERLRDISQILTRTLIHLWDTPPSETYWQSQTLLVATVHFLRDEHKISINQIANYLLLQHSAFAEILEKTEANCKYPKHCPWTLRYRLRTTPEEILKANNIPRKDAFTMRIPQPRDYHHEIAARRQVITSLKNQLIFEGDDCPKCGATWSNVKFVSRHHEFHTLREHACMTCGKSIYTGSIVPVMIHRHGPCEHCGAPKNNLHTDGQTRHGHTLMLCIACNEHSLRPTPESTQARKQT